MKKAGVGVGAGKQGRGEALFAGWAVPMRTKQRRLAPTERAAVSASRRVRFWKNYWSLRTVLSEVKSWMDYG